MVLGVVPGEANAVELDSVQLPQMTAITSGENSWEYSITEFADLQHMVEVAANNPDAGYEIVYSSYETFVIDPCNQRNSSALRSQARAAMEQRHRKKSHQPRRRLPE
jgi:hypothetical protein